MTILPKRPDDGADSGGAPSAGWPERLQRHGAWMLLVLAVVLAHGLAVKAEFFMDDLPHLLENPCCVDGLWWDAGYRMVGYIFFSAIYRWFGASEMAFHAFTLTLHAAVTLSLWQVGRRIVGETLGAGREKAAAFAAFVGALTFACHPLLSEGVNYAQNAVLQLVTLWSVLAVGATWRWTRDGGWKGAAQIAGLIFLGNRSKEVGGIYVALAALTVAVAFPHRAATQRWLSRLGDRRRPILTGLAAAVLAVPFVLPSLRSWILAGTVSRPMWGHHFFTQGVVFWEYVRRFFWPTGLAVDHHIPLSGGWGDAAAVAKTAAFLMLAGLAVWGLRTRRWRLPAALALLALGPIAMRFLYMNQEFFVEYRVYSIMPWVALLVGLAVARWDRAMPKMARLSVLLVAVSWIGTSASRSAVWSDRMTLAEDAVRQYPNNIRIRTQMQKFDYEEGNWLSILDRASECQNAMNRLLEFNRQAPHGRQYELHMAMKNLGCSEQFRALALNELEGSQKALAQANAAIAAFGQINPASVDTDRAASEVTKPLFEVRHLLIKYGPAYDRLRRNPNDEEARREIAEMRRREGA